MTIKEAFDFSLFKLGEIYDRREARQIASILFEDLFSVTNTQRDDLFGGIQQLHSSIERLMRGEPVQHIVGSTNFYGLRFKVNQNVLIPRPETEELTAWILEDHRDSKKQHDVLDIGTGSGCIAVTLAKKNRRMRVFSVEYSLDALNVARINAKNHRVKMDIYRINFLDQDMWSHLGMFDIIVSNPPYISRSERSIMADNVLLYEPELALFPDGDDHLSFYKAISQFGRSHLNEGGLIYLELNEFHVDEIRDMFEEDYVQIEIKQDMQGRRRMLKACLKASDQ